MIRELPESSGRILGVEISDRVSLEAEKAWIRRIEEVMEEYGSFSVLVVLVGPVRWTPDAFMLDLKWLLTHQIEIDRIAVVTDSKLMKVFMASDIPFAKLVGIGEKRFDPTQLAEAWAWVRGQ
jgi:hypothetical protein